MAILIVGGSWANGLAVLSILVAVLVSHLVVRRHGGWELFGPHFYYDVVRLARRGQSTRLRVAYLMALLIALWYAYEKATTGQTRRPNELATVAESFTFVLFLVQNIAILVLTPAYVASAITEEKERHTLELLFTTPLTDKEIVLGILVSRMIHLIGFVLAGIPILSIIQFWGGVDVQLLVGNLVNTLLNIITISSICLLVSTLAKTVSSAVMTSYVVILPGALCLMSQFHGSPFVLHDARIAGSAGLTVQMLGGIALVHAVVTLLCLTCSVAALRIDPAAPLLAPQRAVLSVPPTVVSEELLLRPRKRAVEPELRDALDIPYKLPSVSDNALLWKERFLGGPPLLLSPAVWLVSMPFGVFAFCLLSLWFLYLLGERPAFREGVATWSASLKFCYYIFLGCYGLGTTFRVTSSVARERQKQTLEPLLLLPIDRREILAAKWLGALWRGWPWMALILADVAVGVATGAFHPFSAVFLCLAPWPIISFFTALGLFLSVTVHNVLRANLVMVLVVILFLICMVTSIANQSAFAYIESLAFSTWLTPEHDDPFAERLLFALGIMLGYLLGAWGCWRLALMLFERRSHQMDD